MTHNQGNLKREPVVAAILIAITHGGELLYLQIFSQLSPRSNSVKCKIPLSRSESRDNNNVHRTCQIISQNPKVQ